MKIAILGFGPSAQMAAWASMQYGHSVEFLADAFIQRQNYGVFFLHDACDLPLDGFKIKQMVIGGEGLTAEEKADIYGTMVYGNSAEGWGISLALEKPLLTGYDANSAMLYLELFLKGVKQTTKRFKKYDEVKELLQHYDKVVSTIPASVLFPDKNFPSIPVWVLQEQRLLPDNFFITNLNPEFGWYRISHISGRFSIEYAYEIPAGRPIHKVMQGDLVESTDRILFTGRYGAWNRKIRVEQVYQDTIQFLVGD
jgi:hypothetical protein